MSLRQFALYVAAACVMPVLTAGCGKVNGQADLAALFNNADRIELFSLAISPNLLPFVLKNEAAAGADRLHGWMVLGKISVADPAQREKLAGDIVAAADCFGGDCMRPACFEPRHAIRVASKGAITELVICFECRQAEVHGGGMPSFTLNATPESNLDALLGAANIALSRDLEKRKATPSPLYAAATAGSYKEVVALLEKGTNPDEKWDGHSPLKEAAWLGHQEVVRVLLDAGAKIEGDGSGRTPLQEAAYGGHLEAVRLLIGRGADVKAIIQGDTPLHLATHRGNPQVVAFLLEHGANPNAPNEYHGRTPLHVAAGKGNSEIVKIMLARGGDLTIRSRLGKTPLEEAREDKHDDVVRLMESGAGR